MELSTAQHVFSTYFNEAQVFDVDLNGCLHNAIIGTDLLWVSDGKFEWKEYQLEKGFTKTILAFSCSNKIVHCTVLWKNFASGQDKQQTYG